MSDLKYFLQQVICFIKNMHIFYDISNLLTAFQMFYIYHQVEILAYKILIKKYMYYQYTIRE